MCLHQCEPTLALASKALRNVALCLKGRNLSYDLVAVDLCKASKALRSSASERPATAHLLRSWVRIPPGAWIFVCCECCVLSGRGLCYELITCPEESYRLRCLVVCDLETSRVRRPWPALGRSSTGENIYIYIYIYIYMYKYTV